MSQNQNPCEICTFSKEYQDTLACGCSQLCNYSRDFAKILLEDVLKIHNAYDPRYTCPYIDEIE